MNTFVRIVRLADWQLSKVNYFSVQFEHNEVNEFFDFLNRMEELDEIAEDLSNLLVWMELIGEEYGAIKSKFFRNEAIYADVSGLPPSRKMLRSINLPVQDLRLYCMVLNKQVVILFNGGIKTTQNAKDCPNVGPYIKQANAIAQKIDDMLTAGEIRWKNEFTDIVYDSKLEIEL